MSEQNEEVCGAVFINNNSTPCVLEKGHRGQHYDSQGRHWDGDDRPIIKQVYSSEKPTNPKDLIGSDKLPLHLVPQTAIALEATAFLEGALKYGQYNWRVAGVRNSIYLAACLRHLFKYINGQDHDPSTRVHHLANARACLAIIIDAGVVGKLNDDRPPRADVDQFIGGLEEEVKFLKHIFAGKNPRQFFIGDENENSGT